MLSPKVVVSSRKFLKNSLKRDDSRHLFLLYIQSFV
nr:MAG TPA: hypothetical protein [Caudoviricetes sp.]